MSSYNPSMAHAIIATCTSQSHLLYYNVLYGFMIMFMNVPSCAYTISLSGRAAAVGYDGWSQ